MKDDIKEILEIMWNESFDDVLDRMDVFEGLSIMDNDFAFEKIIEQLLENGWSKAEIEKFGIVNIQSIVSEIATSMLYENGLI